MYDNKEHIPHKLDNERDYNSLPCSMGDNHFFSSPVSPPHPTDSDGGKPIKRASKLVAVFASVLVISGLAGGGAAWLVLNNYAPPQAGTAGSNIVLQNTGVSANIQPESVIATIAEKSADSVVEIATATTKNIPFRGQSVVGGAGSGVIISEDGYIVTNNHVIESTETVIVRTKDGTEYPADIIGADAKTDLAVLKIDASALRAVTFADSDVVRVGELAVAIGNPLGELGGTVTNGIISATSREIVIDNERMTLLQTSAAINPGNSGGGLFDWGGSLIGIVNAKSAGANIEGLGFAIPANTVKQVVNELIQNGYVTGRPALGIGVVEIRDVRTASAYGIDSPGVYIAKATEESGLKEIDRITAIDGTEISSSSDIGDILAKSAVGDTLTVTVDRAGQEIKVEVTLKELGSKAEPV